MVGIPSDREVSQHVRWRRPTQGPVQGESPLSEFQCRFNDLRETQRAKAFQSGNERIGSGAWPGSQYAGKRNKRNLVPFEPVNRSSSRGNRIAVDGKSFLILGAVDKRRNLPTKGMHMWVHYPFSQGGGGRCVKGVAPGLQDTHPRLG